MIFLRPWFLLLLCVPLILFLLKKKLAPENPFVKLIDAHLLPYLTVTFGSQVKRQSIVFFTVMWCGLSLAAAGPAFEKVTAPALVQAPSTVIVMDLSRGMSGENLLRAKQKLYDLLKVLKGQQVALVLYDSKGYVAIPLTQDIGMIENMIPSLATDVLPAQGNQPEKGFETADALFKNVGATAGHIIFLTAGGFDIQTLEKAVQKMPWIISTIGFGDPDGSLIVQPKGGFLKNSDGSLVRVKLDEDGLSRLGYYTRATLTDADVLALKNRTPQSTLSHGTATNQMEVWKDIGPWMILCLAPFFVLFFRKGVLYLLILGISFPAAASFFERPDQQAHAAVVDGVKAYRQGLYEEALKNFEQGRGSDALYNKGNALAFMGDIQGAIEAYKQALALNPTHAEAKYNKEYLERQMQQQQPQPQTSSQSQPEQQKQEQDQQSDPQKQESTDKSQENSENKENQQSQSQKQENQQNASQSDQSEGQDQKQEDQGTQKQEDQNKMGQEKEEPMQTPQTEQEQNSPDGDQQEGNSGQQGNELDDQNPSQAQEGAQDAQQAQPQEPSDQPANRLGEDKYEVEVEELDQDSQQLLNKVQQDPSRLLKFRLKQQYRRAYEQQN